MSTYSEIQTRVASELNRSDLSSDIQTHILQAINFYEGERWYFSEASTTLTATVSQNYVDVPTGFQYEDLLQITISGRNIDLIKKDLDWIMEYRRVTNGRPMAYAFYQNRFELDCPSDDTYSLPIKYVKALTALSSGSDTNIWTTDLSDLIVYRACKTLSASKLKNLDQAKIYAGLEAEAYGGFKSSSDDKVSMGHNLYREA